MNEKNVKIMVSKSVRDKVKLAARASRKTMIVFTEDVLLEAVAKVPKGGKK